MALILIRFKLNELFPACIQLMLTYKSVLKFIIVIIKYGLNVVVFILTSTHRRVSLKLEVEVENANDI